MSGRTCHHCGSTEIDDDPSRGDSVCTKCGSVLENTVIVSELQFEENAYGGSSAVGQFVSVDGGKSQHTSIRGLKTGLGRESREVTLKNAKKRISQLCQLLRLNHHCMETAFNFYKMALHRRLTHGVRNPLIIASCVYITCRTEGQPHMLIDLADTYQVDVFALGRTYMKLTQTLHINLPILDPCVYILRFCHKMGFAEKTQAVSNTALRLVQRMKRDWIHTGRRPSGLCGAALLIAARMHDFNRTVDDVVKIVKIHESTLRKRLMEFGETPSGKLTVEEFMSVDLEEEADPPAYKDARKKDRDRINQIIENQKQELGKEFSELTHAIEKTLVGKQKRPLGVWASYAKDLKAFASEVENGDQVVEFIETDGMDDTLKSLILGIPPEPEFLTDEGKNIPDDETSIEVAPPPVKRPAVEVRYAVPRLPRITGDHEVTPEGLGPSREMLGLIPCAPGVAPPPPSHSLYKDDSNGELDLEGIDDEEIDSYLMSPVEVRQKSLLWTTVNHDYLRQQEEKRRIQEAEAAAKQAREELEEVEGVGAAAAKKSVSPRKKRKQGGNNLNLAPSQTAQEAIEKILSEKKISAKINYDVLKNLGIVTAPDVKAEVKCEEHDSISIETEAETASASEAAFSVASPEGKVLLEATVRRRGGGRVAPKLAPRRRPVPVKVEPVARIQRSPSLPIEVTKEVTVERSLPLLPISPPPSTAVTREIEIEIEEDDFDDEEEEEGPGDDEEENLLRDFRSRYGAGDDDDDYDDS